MVKQCEAFTSVAWGPQGGNEAGKMCKVGTARPSLNPQPMVWNPWAHLAGSPKDRQKPWGPEAVCYAHPDPGASKARAGFGASAVSSACCPVVSAAAEK